MLLQEGAQSFGRLFCASALLFGLSSSHDDSCSSATPMAHAYIAPDRLTDGST